MSTFAEKKAAKRARRPIYGTIERVAVLATGEERLALLAQHPIDRRLMKERGYHEGDEVRMEIKKPRNVQFHRLMHAIGNLLVENVEEFRDIGGHDAIKRVQLASGVCCDVIEMNASPVVKALLDAAEVLLGAGARKILAGVLPEIKTIPVTVARSMAFDEMAEDEFKQLFEGITQYIGDHYAGVMLDEVRAEYWLMVQGEQGA